MIYTIYVPGWRPPLLNQSRGRHWRVGARLTKDAARVVGAFAKLAGVPRATAKRRVTLTLVLGRHCKRCDRDAPWKHLLDGMKQAGLIVNDSPDWVEAMPLEFVKGTERGTRIVLEDISQ